MHKTSTSADSRGPKILIAHPDLSYRTAVAWFLRQHGCQVTATGTGASLREWARISRPDICLVADRLGDESGFLTSAKLRMEFPRARILLLVERISPEDERFARYAGAEGVLRRQEGMKGLLERVLEQVAV